MKYQMPDSTTLVRRLEKALYETTGDTSYDKQKGDFYHRIGDVTRRGLLKVWQPRWNRLAKGFEEAGTSLDQAGTISSALAIVRLYAERDRTFSGMQNASRGFPFADEHHDWMTKAMGVLEAAAEKGSFPTLQDVDPYANEYLPRAKTPVTAAGLVGIRDGVVAPFGKWQGDVIFGFAERYTESLKSKKKPRVRLSVLLGHDWKPFKVDVQYGGPSGFTQDRYRQVADWLRIKGRMAESVAGTPEYLLCPARVMYEQHGGRGQGAVYKQAGVFVVAGDYPT